MLKEFKEFAVKGNAFDMAVGIIIGAAFGGIVSSLVNDIVTPPIALLLGSVDFSNQFFVLKDANGSGVYSTLADAKKAGAVTLNFGVFVNALINFLIVAFALFFMVRTVNKLRTKEETAVSGVPARECPFCKQEVHTDATRCHHCTSELPSSK